jgi:transcriptional regulator with XRE-family HTH domain
MFRSGFILSFNATDLRAVRGACFPEIRVNAMSQGAIARYIDELEQRGGLKGTDVANITDVSKATVSRWRTGTIKPQPKNELILSDLHYIVGRLSEYYSSDEIRTWLYARHPQLDGQRAMDLIHEDRAIDVLKVIDRLDAEVYL